MINMDIFKNSDDDDDHDLKGSDVFILILFFAALAVIVFGLLTVGSAFFIPVFIGITLIGTVLEWITALSKRAAQLFSCKHESEDCEFKKGETNGDAK